LSDGKKLTIEDIAGAEQLRVNSRRGIIDIIRGGSPPLDFDTVSDRADTVEWVILGRRYLLAASRFSKVRSGSSAACFPQLPKMLRLTDDLL
jgi:hypothetical protein